MRTVSQNPNIDDKTRPIKDRTGQAENETEEELQTHISSLSKHNATSRISPMNVGNVRTRESFKKLIAALKEKSLISQAYKIHAVEETTLMKKVTM